jgi:hypothetical protein
MSDSKRNFGELFIHACDSYLDISSCKEFSSAIFDSQPSEQSQQDDVREDYVPLRKVSFEDNLPVESGEDDEEEDEHVFAVREHRQEAMNKDIFRVGQKRPLPQEGGCSELCKLYRCTAWSMDSECSDVEASSTYSVSDNTVSFVHWDNVLKDSRELKRHFSRNGR